MDNRGKRIIFLSQCLLNQNLRFPGIAVKSGAINELLTPIIEQGIGIEVLPCLERMGWGGVKRETFYKYLPLITKNIGSYNLPFIKFFLRRWLRIYKKKCSNQAIKVVKKMLDYCKSGYSIVGVITTNDSPTCGITKTIDLLDVLPRFKDLGLVDEFENPTYEKMKNIIPTLCENGTGYFTDELLNQIKKYKLDVKIVGFDIWNNLAEESERVLKKLRFMP